MENSISFIEKQFPVSKISKESYKERKSSQGQTITGLGKWWGRKPLILVRAAIIGCLMPASDNPQKDMEIFCKILSIDDTGLNERKEKKFSLKELYSIVNSNKKLHDKYKIYFESVNGKIKLIKDAPRDEIELATFGTLGLDAKLSMCMRPEQLHNLQQDTWNDINHHLGINAKNLKELIEQLSMKRYGHKITVGDCFCGGGSIPFEAARIGCNSFASDLNPIAGLLTWSDINICGASKENIEIIKNFQKKAYDEVEKYFEELKLETNEVGDNALSYLYCLESECPECGWTVPLLPSLVVGIRAGKVVAELHEKTDDKKFNIEIINDVSSADIKKAQSNGTVKNSALICPHCGKKTPISSLRHDYVDDNGNTVYGLRKWECSEYKARKTDTYHERLYAIRYERKDGSRYYCKPSAKDIENEQIIHKIVEQNIQNWQDKGIVPSSEIESGYNTDQVIRERGWKYWHQLYNPRQILMLAKLSEQIMAADTSIEKVAGILGLNKCADFGSSLCRWNPNCDKTEQTFYNQALNTLFNWGVRSLTMLKTLWFRTSESEEITSQSKVVLSDARDIDEVVDYWITDPPYADAVNYHELSEYFLAWDKSLIKAAFPNWYADSKRILAVKGDAHFAETMIEIYRNLANHMTDSGMQIVMFTHSDPAVWAQLAVIMWKAGLKVTAAWNIATETDASGLKDGNYVKGTVLLVLRKRTEEDMAFLDEINADIRSEVRNQIESMQQLDDKEEPNFSDPDYVLAAYAASLKVLTSYESIEDLNLDYELNQAIQNPTGSQVVAIIENAKKIAYDCVIPLEFNSYLWRELSNAEKFYIKGLESEKHGNYQISTYQEFARGFSIGGYSQIMASERANTARLKTPYEMASRTISEIPDFENSLMRTIFTGIYVGIKEDKNPNKALGFIKNEINNYWDKREMIQQILEFIIDVKNISNMQKHWFDSVEMAELLLALVVHDSI